MGTEFPAPAERELAGPRGLARRTVGAIGLTFVAMTSGRVLTTVATFLLARLLSPSDFGVANLLSDSSTGGIGIAGAPAVGALDDGAPERHLAERGAEHGPAEAVPEARRSAVRLLAAASSYAVLRRRGPVPRAVVELVSAALDVYLCSRPGKERVVCTCCWL